GVGVGTSALASGASSITGTSGWSCAGDAADCSRVGRSWPPSPTAATTANTRPSKQQDSARRCAGAWPIDNLLGFRFASLDGCYLTGGLLLADATRTKRGGGGGVANVRGYFAGTGEASSREDV